MQAPTPTKNCRQLLKEFYQKDQLFKKGEKLVFENPDKKCIYNITAPFENKGIYYIAARVESCPANWLGEYDTETRFFAEENGIWKPTAIKPIVVEDPALTRISNQIILMGTEILVENNERVYRTVFYRGQHLNNLKKFSHGPTKMKDIRLIQLADKRIGVFTRPQFEFINNQGKKIYKKQIGFIIIDNLEQLNEKCILKAKIIEGQFFPEEWGGVNEPHLLKNNQIGTLGHIAYRDKKGNKHYYAMTFIFDPFLLKATPIKIIAVRKNFPFGPARRKDLKNVVFPGGIIKNNDNTCTLYCGLSDCESGKISLPYIF